MTFLPNRGKHGQWERRKKQGCKKIKKQFLKEEVWRNGLDCKWIMTSLTWILPSWILYSKEALKMWLSSLTYCDYPRLCNRPKAIAEIHIRRSQKDHSKKRCDNPEIRMMQGRGHGIECKNTLNHYKRQRNPIESPTPLKKFSYPEL